MDHSWINRPKCMNTPALEQPRAAPDPQVHGRSPAQSRVRIQAPERCRLRLPQAPREHAPEGRGSRLESQQVGWGPEQECTRSQLGGSKLVAEAAGEKALGPLLAVGGPQV